MLIELDAGALVAASQGLFGFAQYVQDGKALDNCGLSLSDSTRLKMIEHCRFIGEKANQLGLRGTKVSTRRAIQTLESFTPQEKMPSVNNYDPILESSAYWVISRVEIDVVHRAVFDVANRLRDELEERSFLAFSSDASEALFVDSAPFDESVSDAFPSSEFDIREAAKCKALSRWTACVLHLMRALEPALLLLQNAVNVAVPKEQWDQIINQIDAKIREIKKQSHGKGDEQWYSEAASHFRLMKNAWRNYAAHGRKAYNEEECEAIYTNVKYFMRHLATRLREES
jgi:hypothetical protein